MGKVTIMLNDKLEMQLRQKHILKKGDLSDKINEALKEWLDHQ